MKASVQIPVPVGSIPRLREFKLKMELLQDNPVSLMKLGKRSCVVSPALFDIQNFV